MLGARALRCRGFLLPGAGPVLALSYRYGLARGTLQHPVPAEPWGHLSWLWSPVPARSPPHPMPAFPPD